MGKEPYEPPQIVELPKEMIEELLAQEVHPDPDPEVPDVPE